MVCSGRSIHQLVLSTRLHGHTGRGGGNLDSYLSWVWELVRELVAVQIDRVGWGSRVDDHLRELVREDLLESILKSFLDKGWDSCTGIVGVSEIKMMGVRDHGVEGALHVSKGLFHGIEGFLLLGKKMVAAVGRIKHMEVSVICEVEEILLIVEVVEHGVSEFFVIEGNEFLSEVEWYGGRGNIFFVGFSVRDGFFLDGEEDFGR